MGKQLELFETTYCYCLGQGCLNVKRLGENEWKEDEEIFNKIMARKVDAINGGYCPDHNSTKVEGVEIYPGVMYFD